MESKMAIYDVGDSVKVSGTFKVAGVDTDPTTVTVSYKKPDGTVVSKVYLTDAEVVKDATGQYHMDIPVDASGRWHYRFVGTDAAKAAEEGDFYVRVQAVA